MECGSPVRGTSWQAFGGAATVGQATFRIAVLDAYSRRCAITGERSLPVIEASHIQPFSHGGTHVVPNGLPLRRDIHRLFDLGYVSVRPDCSFAVSQALRDEYENGRVYYEMAGRKLRDPAHPGTEPTLRSWSGTTTRCFDSRSPAHRIGLEPDHRVLPRHGEHVQQASRPETPEALRIDAVDIRAWPAGLADDSMAV